MSPLGPAKSYKAARRIVVVGHAKCPRTRRRPRSRQSDLLAPKVSLGTEPAGGRPRAQPNWAPLRMAGPSPATTGWRRRRPREQVAIKLLLTFLLLPPPPLFPSIEPPRGAASERRAQPQPCATRRGSKWISSVSLSLSLPSRRPPRTVMWQSGSGYSSGQGQVPSRPHLGVDVSLAHHIATRARLTQPVAPATSQSAKPKPRAKRESCESRASTSSRPGRLLDARRLMPDDMPPPEPSLFQPPLPTSSVESGSRRAPGKRPDYNSTATARSRRVAGSSYESILPPAPAPMTRVTPPSVATWPLVIIISSDMKQLARTRSRRHNRQKSSPLHHRGSNYMYHLLHSTLQSAP